MKSDYADFHPIVCDNNSSDGSVEQITRWIAGEILTSGEGTDPSKPVTVRTYEAVNFVSPIPTAEVPDITVIQTGDNLGFAGGNNVGIKYALDKGDCDYIWLLNNDTTVEPDALSKMVEHSRKLASRGIKNTCGSVICFYDKPEMIQALGGSTFSHWTGIAHDAQGKYRLRHEEFNHAQICGKINYIMGSSWLVPKTFIDDIGLMEEGYFLYYEEADWALRSSHLYTMTYAANAVVYHKGGSTIGSRKLNKGPSVTADFYMARSRKKFMKKFFPNRSILVWCSLILQALNRVKQGKVQNASVILQAALGK